MGYPPGIGAARPHRAIGPLIGADPGPVVFLAAACTWLTLCFVFLVLLIPVGSVFGLAVRTVIALAPLFALAILIGGAVGARVALLTLLVLMFVMTDLSIRQRALTDTSLDAQNVVKLAVWGLGLLVAVFHRDALRRALSGTPHMWLLLFALWCTATALYSPIPMYTLGGGIAFVAMVLFAIVVRSRMPDALVLKAGLYTFGCLTWLALAMYLAIPDRAMAAMEGGSIMRLAGPFGSPNNLGRIAAIALLMCTWSLLTRTHRLTSPGLVLVSVGAIACLYLSQSRTAGLAFCLSVLVLLAIRRASWAFGLLALTAAAALVWSLLDIRIDDVAALVSRTGHVSELTTMTGRTTIWQFVWGEIQKEPLLGYGFASTKYTIPLGYRDYWGWTTASAHNMWLQVWMTTGLVGVVLLAAALLSQVLYCWRTEDVVSASLLIFVLILGLAEGSALGPAPNVLTVVWALWMARQAPLRVGHDPRPAVQPP